MSIRSKLTITFLAIAALPLALVSLLTFKNYRDSLEESFISQLQNLASLKTESIETYFDRLKIDIQMTYNFYNIRRNLPILNRFAANPDSSEFLEAKTMLDMQLRPMQEVLGLFDIMLVSPDGKVIYASNPKHFSGNFLKPMLDPAQKAFEEGKKGVYFSDVFANPLEANDLAILITAPAYDINDVPSGVIAFEVDIASIYDIIQDVTGLGRTGEVLLGKQIGDEVVFLNPLRHDPQAIVGSRLPIGDTLGGPIQEAIAGRKGAGILLDYRGEKVIAAWQHIPYLNWGLVAKIDAEEGFADVITLRNLEIIIMTLVLGISAVTALSLAKGISGPIKHLSDGAAIIGRGNLDYKVATEDRDEIGQLSRTFDKMTGDLKQTLASRDELNREIAERRHAEDELRESEERFRTMANAMQQLAWIAKPDGYIFWYNQRWYDYTGTTPEQMEGWGWQSVHDPVLLPKIMEQWKASIAAGTLFEMEFPLKGADGNFHHFLTRGVPLKDAQGRVVQWFGTNTDINDLKQAEEALRKSTEDLDRAQAVGNIGSWRLDMRKNELTWSDENHRIFGIPKGTPMTYETFLSTIHPDDREYVDMQWKAAMAGKPYDIEHRIVVQGEVKWVREKAYLEFDESGRLLGGFGTTQDITKRKADQEALRQSEARYRSIISTALDGFWQVDTDGRFIDVNNAICIMLGYTRDEMLQMKIADIEAVEHPEDVIEHTKRITEKGADRFESRQRRKDRKIIDVDVSTTAVKDAQGIRIFAFVREITERKQAERALKKAKDELEMRVKERTAQLDQTVQTLKEEVLERIAAEEAVRKGEDRYRSLTVATTQVVWTTDADGQVVEDLPSWRDFTGQTAEEIQGWGWINALHSEDRDRTAAIWNEAIRSRSLYQTEYRMRRRDGEYRYVSVRGVPVVEPGGGIREWIGTCTDITEKKTAEAELEKYRLHLEELVKQRTEDLARSNKDLEQFAYVASHDLQEPLRAVAGFVHLLKQDMKDLLDGKKLEYMNFVIDGVVRMQALINGLLEYSRIGSKGKKPEATDAKKALDNAVANLHMSIKESGAKITSDDLPTVLFDAAQLSRLFQNLIGNAIKFRGEQPPRIHISAERNGEDWRFAVRDNGIGIEPQYAERIFLLFQRLHGRDKYPGTGIGLTICRRIVERHGGRIWVEPNSDAGSTFYFTVPEKNAVS